MAYQKGTPLISDEEFDNLADAYDFYEIGIIDEVSKPVEHAYRMYSLEKFYEEDGVHYPPNDVIINTPKLDGSAISLLYVSGILVQAQTRGDGFIGEDITDKMLASPMVPNRIPRYNITQITGEVVAKKTIENARNYAAGAMNLKDLEDFLSRELIFIAYGIQSAKPISPSYYQDMKYLEDVGFNSVIESEWIEYPQDGRVIRIDSNANYFKAGFTSKHPKGAFAVKKRSDVVTLKSTLREVLWQLGKGGKVTPVAIFDPIVIEDATITRATLHNVGFIETWNLSIGDTILITRAGGIIPKIVGVA